MNPTIVTVHVEPPEERDEWMRHLVDALGDGFEVLPATDPRARYGVAWAPPERFFEAQPDLHAVFSVAAGVDHLLRVPSLPATLPVYRLEDAGMAAQMVRYCRHEVEHVLLHRPRYEAQQRVADWHQHPVREPGELSVGVFGHGVLGQRVAAALHDEGYRVRAYGRGRRPQAEAAYPVHAGPGEWEGFLDGLDVLILLAPLTPLTRGIIDAAALAHLAPQAWLVNVGRGALIDEPAVIGALRAGRLGGASLDVFAQEPLPTDHPFWSDPRVRITPHVSAVTRIGPSARQIAARILALEKGGDAGRAVDRTAGY